MPTESQVLRCGNCGANVSPVAGQTVVQCEYCGQATYLTQTVVGASAVTRASTSSGAQSSTKLHSHLMGGPSSALVEGRCVRFTTAKAKYEALVPVDRAIWPSRASASSTYGGSWSPSAMVGPPKVFPRCGDLGGAWAPATSTSSVEWVELEFNSQLPVTGVRIYETNKAGSVFAVVDLTSDEELLYAGPTESRNDACVLEVTFDTPRVVRRLRAYLTNTRGFSEIDTVALLARDPLPAHLRPQIPPPTRALSVGATMALAACVVGACVAGLAVMVASESSSSGALMTPAAESVAGVLSAGTPPMADLLARNPQWAQAVLDFSTEYTSDGNSALQAVGAPDVYPRFGDIPQAWAPRSADDGVQHVSLRFGATFPVDTLLWVATFNPGAVVRVDDISDAARPVTLWTGSDPSRGMQNAVVELRLPQPRAITALRLFLDTSQVTGWNEIDAVALVP